MFVAFFFCATVTNAQEKQDNPLDEHIRASEEINNNRSDELIINKEIHRDSLTIRQTPLQIQKAKTDTSNKEKKEEEPLSFNLLYFIIQKFKVSDIVN